MRTIRRSFVLAALLLVAVSLPSFAIDFTRVIVDLDGKPLQNAGVDMTLGETATHALLAHYEGERNLGDDEKLKRFLLAAKIRQAKDAKLTADEIALIKKLVAKAFAPLVVGRVWEIIDPASVQGK
jgi:hypothetical protein